jgi:hypothetical protein
MQHAVLFVPVQRANSYVTGLLRCKGESRKGDQTNKPISIYIYAYPQLNLFRVAFIMASHERERKYITYVILPLNGYTHYTLR